MKYQEFWHNGNPEISKDVSYKFYKALLISSSNKDIQEEIDGLREIGFDYEEESKILKDKWIVFWHGEGIGYKHKYIIKPSGLFCGTNNVIGSLNMTFDVVTDEYTNLPEPGDCYFKKYIDLWHDMEIPNICDCRKLFHYTTYFFSPRYFQGTKVFDNLEKAYKYFNRINFMTHYYGNNQLSL